jgi:hypothetical protein
MVSGCSGMHLRPHMQQGYVIRELRFKDTCPFMGGAPQEHNVGKGGAGVTNEARGHRRDWSDSCAEAVWVAAECSSVSRAVAG